MLPNLQTSHETIVVGRSAKMRAVFDFVNIIGRSDSTVLITGESGTGKEVVARLIHETSRRKHRPFIAVSCALFSDTLIESELFGHERGAFTGAIKDCPGRFEMAEGGTIFLDDIDDVPLGMQVKLLRVLQNRTVERLGGIRLVPVNVRVLAGSKRNLKQMVADGKFREDLYHLLNVLPLTLPPLRDRREDIPDLMEAFIERFFRGRGEPAPPISPAVAQAFTEVPVARQRARARKCLRAHRANEHMWDGADRLRGSEHPVPCRPDTPEPTVVQTPLRPAGTSISLDDRLREVKANLIRWALDTSHGNKSQAAALLQVKRSTLGDRIRHCRLESEPADGHEAPAPTPA